METAQHSGARRSMLIVPAGRQRTVDKCFETEADIVMLDLDDGVVYNDAEKSAARDRVVQAIANHSATSKEVVVRTNGLDTEWWEADLEAVAAATVRPLAVVPAKVDTADEVNDIARVLSRSSENQIQIWPMVESVASVLNAHSIATSNQRVGALCFGVGDYTVTAHGEFSDNIDHLNYPLSKTLCAARAAGITAIAPAVVWTDVTRIDLLTEQARYLRLLGYDGAMVVTPKHLDAVNDVFTPSTEAVSWALRVESALAEAHASGQSAAVVDGRLVEIVNFKRTQHTLKVARALNLV